MNIFDTGTIVNFILVAILASVLLVLPFKWFNSSTDKQYLYQRKENWWILAGFVIAVGAVSIPFVLMYAIDTNIAEILKQSSDAQGKNLDYLSILASMGDFLGGTTVGLLSLASIIFVTAAIFMQKEELELQRKEVSATRREYEITNATMKKQQFDSTFFNMINLHQRILNDIEINNKKGKEALIIVIDRIKITYQTKIFNEHISQKKTELIEGDNYLKILEILFENRALNYLESRFLNCENELMELNEIYMKDNISNEEHQNKLFKIEILKEERLNTARKQFFDKLRNDKELREDMIDKLDLDDCIELYRDNEYIKKINNDTYSATLIDLKRKAFTRVYQTTEPQIGHYFRNLYHIFKLINDLNIYSDEGNNIEEKNRYKAILRAQLSSKELLLLFYNVAYSPKGEGFKELIIGTNFFDDHINNEDLIWGNDSEEIDKLNTVK